MSTRDIVKKDPADFTPTLGNYTDLQPFRFWCQKVLPLVYDDSLSYYELLCKVVDYLNKTMEDVGVLEADVTGLHEAYKKLQGYVNDYFSTLDVQEEINNKLDIMTENGTLSNLISAYVKVSPQYANNTTDMTDKTVLYINGADGYLYKWNGSDWTSTGILYQSAVTPIAFYGTLVRDTMSVSIKDNVVTVTFGDNARLQTKNGNTTSVNGGSVTLTSPLQNNIICYNSITSSIESYAHSNINVCKPEITCLFNVYNNVVYEYNIPLHYNGVYINIKHLTFARTFGTDNFTITPTTEGYSISPSNYLIDSYGKLHTIVNASTVFTVNKTIFNWLCFNRISGEFVNLPYNSSLLNTMPYDLVCGFYKNDVVNLLSNVINTSTNVVNLKNSCIIKGNIFVRISGKYVIADCTPTARALIHGVNTNISNFTLKKEANTTVIRYLTINENGLDCVKDSELKENDTIIALCYQHSVVPLEIGVICNALPLTELTQRNNIPYHVVWDRLGYEVTYNTFTQNNNNYVMGDKWLTIMNGYDISPGLAIIDEYGKPNTLNVTIKQNTSNISNKKILMIGDSITNRGWLQQYISERVSVNFVGTKQTGDGVGVKDYMCEGYPGKTSTWVIGNNSPFWNPNTNKFDFHYYCTLHSIEPDIVTIEFGLNERIYGDAFAENLQLMIDNIHAHNSDISVYIVIPFRMRKGAHNNGYSFPEEAYTYNVSCMLSCETLTDCTLIPTWFVLNDKYDYNVINANYGYGDITYETVNDPIHPSQTIGFKKLADMIYSYLS